jgi:amidase
VSEIHELSALAQAAAVANGEVSPAELVEHYLARIETYADGLGAFVTVTADAARAEASAALPRPESASPLYGVPTAIKDNTTTVGVRTTFGSKAYADFVPDVDAYCAALLRGAGTISLGKTNTPEFGLSAYTDNDVIGPAVTPWDRTRNAGGSSGGAAAAVAAGLVPVAHGNDGGGSARIPASACGVFGLKPARGRVSPGPAGVDLFGLGVQGALARHVADAAAYLDVMAVPMVGDANWAPPLPPGETFLNASRRDPGRLRIARYSDAGLPDVVTDPACAAAWEHASEILAGLGHDVVDVANPFPAEVAGIFDLMWASQSLLFPVPPQAEPVLRPVSRHWRERGRMTSAEELVGALGRLQLIARRVVESFAPYDAILTPTLALPPQTSAWFAADGDVLVELARQVSFAPFAATGNLTGMPAASLPLHWTDDDLPIGVMLTGRPAGEAALLSLCAQIEAAHPWSHRWPPL